jgi:hypothetical protein
VISKLCLRTLSTTIAIPRNEDLKDGRIIPVETVREDYTYSQDCKDMANVPQKLLNEVNMREHHATATISFQTQLVQSFPSGVRTARTHVVPF